MRDIRPRDLRVMLWPQDFDGPGCYRLLFPAEAMRDAGAGRFGLPLMKPKANPFSPGEFVADATLANPLLDCDVHVLQQRLESEFAVSLVRHLKARGKGVVVDFDDFYEGAPSWNAGVASVRKLKDRSVGVLRPQRQLADLVTCSTPFLAEAYAKDNPNTVVLRNGLDWRMWSRVKPMWKRPVERLRVGWVGAAPWREGDLKVLASWFPAWIKAHPDVLFVAAGTDGDRVHDLLMVPGAQRVTIPYLDFKTFKHPDFLVAQMHVGFVPLVRCDFNEAKSHLKGMEYNAAGIPYIASPSESYRYWGGLGGGGVIAESPSEWRDALDEMLENESLRAELGKRGRALAEQHSLQNRWRDWFDAWGSTAGGQTDSELALQAVSYGAIQKSEEFAGLLELARGCKTIVEVGSSAGGSMWAWARVAADNALLVSIDLPEGVGGGQLSHLAEKRQESFRRGKQSLHMIRGDSHAPETLRELKKILGDCRIDLLFIDGDHTYEGVKRDWDMYGPLADIVAFHDIVTHPEQRWCKVDELWAELKPGRKTREFVQPWSDPSKEWGGIGVVFQ